MLPNCLLATSVYFFFSDAPHDGAGGVFGVAGGAQKCQRGPWFAFCCTDTGVLGDAKEAQKPKAKGNGKVQVQSITITP